MFMFGGSSWGQPRSPKKSVFFLLSVYLYYKLRLGWANGRQWMRGSHRLLSHQVRLAPHEQLTSRWRGISRDHATQGRPQRAAGV